MTDRLKKIRARAEAATPGPWTVTDDGVLSSGVPPSSPVANGDFIAHARDHVPWMLDEIERLKGEVAMLVARYGEADGARLVEKDRADKAEDCALRMHTELHAYALTVMLYFCEPPPDRIHTALADPVITEIKERQV